MGIKISNNVTTQPACPYVGMFNDGDNQFYVLFTSYNEDADEASGYVVEVSKQNHLCDYVVGKYSDVWNVNKFAPVDYTMTFDTK